MSLHAKTPTLLWRAVLELLFESPQYGGWSNTKTFWRYTHFNITIHFGMFLNPDSLTSRKINSKTTKFIWKLFLFLKTFFQPTSGRAIRLRCPYGGYRSLANQSVPFSWIPDRKKFSPVISMQRRNQCREKSFDFSSIKPNFIPATTVHSQTAICWTQFLVYELTSLGNLRDVLVYQVADRPDEYSMKAVALLSLF